MQHRPATLPALWARLERLGHSMVLDEEADGAYDRVYLCRSCFCEVGILARDGAYSTALVVSIDRPLVQHCQSPWITITLDDLAEHAAIMRSPRHRRPRLLRPDHIPF